MGRAPTHENPNVSVACVGILKSQFTRIRNGYFLDLHQKDSGNGMLRTTLSCRDQPTTRKHADAPTYVRNG